MAYTKTNWFDRAVEFVNRYTKSGETADEVTLVQKPGTITQAGTPLNSANLNKIEQGIFDAAATADSAAAAAAAAQSTANTKVSKSGDTMAGDLRFTNDTSPHTIGIRFHGDGSGWRFPFKRNGDGTVVATIRDDGEMFLALGTQQAYHGGFKPHATGSYVGDDGTNRDIALPFTPSLVIVSITDNATIYTGNFGLATSAQPLKYSGATICLIGTNKFTVNNNGSSNGINAVGKAYNWIAFR
ncbi:hypothetical protein [Paenibacillus harenae]|uniref:hypothetical protein n=1 Tax=Paenibacillus harenae TaxID=306543 RepID=UPI0004192AE0|nr:hypothetical protein [Paenibacillus harenae]